MSVFSEQNARLAQGLVDAKAAIEAKKGTVAVSKTTPQIEEIVTGISTIKSGGVRILLGATNWEDQDYITNSFQGVTQLKLQPIRSINKETITFTDNILTQ